MDSAADIPDVSGGMGLLNAREAGLAGIAGGAIFLASLPLAVYPTASAVIQAEIDAFAAISTWSFLAPFVATVVAGFSGLVGMALGADVRRRRHGAPVGFGFLALIAFMTPFVLSTGIWGFIAGGLFLLAASSPR